MSFALIPSWQGRRSRQRLTIGVAQLSQMLWLPMADSFILATERAHVSRRAPDHAWLTDGL